MRVVTRSMFRLRSALLALVSLVASLAVSVAASATPTWTPLNSSPSTAGAPQAYGLAVSDNGVHMAVAMSYGYIWVSSDSGASFSTPQVADMNSSTKNWRDVDSSADGQIMVAVGIDLLWRSSDAGATWTDVNPRLDTTVQFLDVEVSDDGRYVMACAEATGTSPHSPVYISSNGGVTFTQSSVSRRFTGCASNVDGSVMYTAAGGQSSDMNGGLYKSTDFGVTWTHIRPAYSLNSSSTLDRSAWFVDTDDAGTAVALTYYGSSSGFFYRSMDGGATWTASPTSLSILRRPAVQTYDNRTFFHAVINGGYTFSEGLGNLTSVTVLANRAASDFVITSNLSKSWLLNYDDVIYTTGAIQTVQDATAPSVSLTQATLVQPANAVTSTSERGTVYLVHSSVNVTSVSDITSASGNMWNSISALVTNTSLNVSTNGLIDGTYRAYAVDLANNISAASTNSVVLGAPSIVAPSPTTTIAPTTTTIAPVTTTPNSIATVTTTTAPTAVARTASQLPTTGSNTQAHWATAILGMGVLFLLRVRVQRRYEA